MFNNMLFPDNALQRQLTPKELFNIYPKTASESAPSLATQSSGNNSDSLLTRQQLLEVSQNISKYYAPKILSNTHTLVLLSVDPENFHVYWNLADYHQYNDGQHQHDALKLRVFSQYKEYKKNKKAKLIYETTVSTTQSRQKIYFHKEEQGVVYTASLGRFSPEDSRFIALVNSNEVYSLYDRKNQSHTKNTCVENNFAIGSNDRESIHIMPNGNKPKPIKTHFSSSNPSGHRHK